jgi:hypothetical protein
VWCRGSVRSVTTQGRFPAHNVPATVIFEKIRPRQIAFGLFRGWGVGGSNPEPTD